MALLPDSPEISRYPGGTLIKLGFVIPSEAEPPVFR